LAGNPKKAASTGKLILLLIGQLFSSPTRLRKKSRASQRNNRPSVRRNHRKIDSYVLSCFMLKKEKFLYPIELIKALLLFQKYVPLDLMLVL
jgi:hypothetical protein